MAKPNRENTISRPLLSSSRLHPSFLLHAAESVDGKWRGETQGKSASTLDLAVKDTELTRTITRKDSQMKIEAGKIVGNTLTFRTVIQDRTESFTAEFTKEGIRLWMDRLGRETLRRAKE